ncbi:(d)CMP kinase [Immundisolibacter cernigliae]|uniref:Cytidylate kinase n=1 Tax=Immundisolibacter cernigliae TaxID=1810504 RepID=A0A1B1YWL2_9GAMM|nr:(d)CMP kinase [Immundisolibacter cernigliae]ANX04993.1 cytidylate kinase [Immundisolibacter cernigliae]
MSEAPVVTIDGPGGAGKGTVSLMVARRLGWHYLDSGALYRLVAVAAARDGLDIDDGDALARRVGQLRIEFHLLTDALQVQLDGVDVTAAIREEACARSASRLAVHARLRSVLLPLQRAFARPPGLVAEGRDMGTVVFPQAPLKVFLTASVEQRARRRWLQLSAAGVDASLDAILDELRRRDAQDASRATAPLRPADDAVLVDSSDLTADEVCARILGHCQERGLTVGTNPVP